MDLHLLKGTPMTTSRTGTTGAPTTTRTTVQKAALAVGIVFLVVAILGFVRS
jgi:hypothetical protein